MRPAPSKSLLLCSALAMNAFTLSVRADDVVVQQPPAEAASPAPAPATPATTTTTTQSTTQPTTAAQPVAQQAPSRPVVQQTNVNTEDQYRPSPFMHGFQGLIAGTLVGGSAGYLIGRRDGWKSSDWRAVGLGFGIGALAGAGLGLSVGFADSPGTPGARYITRDMLGGSFFGGLVGVIGGGIAAGVKHKPERALFGTTIGVIAGAGLGIITGIVEGQTREKSTKVTTTSRLRIQPDLMMTRAVNGSNTFAPGISGRF